MEKLSAAIARVQFVQVYLDDSGLSFPEDIDAAAETEQASAGTNGPDLAANLPSEVMLADPRTAEKSPGDLSTQPSRSDAAPTNQRGELADPSTFEDFSETSRAPGSSTPDIFLPSESSYSQAALVESAQTEKDEKSRPRLEQSSFSWMLGQQDPPPRASSHSPNFSTERSGGKGFLFGDDTEDNGVQRRSGRGVVKR